MVKTFFIFYLTWIAAPAHADDLGFRAECLKPEVFQGETVACSFVIASTDEMVEVEVAKFPEFRGFWSENVALRQGPIPLLSMPFGDNTRKGVVGTYSLIPMLGRTDTQIMPMKIVVRHPMSAISADLIIESEPATLKVKPLPPIPPELAQEKFFGAVGAFTVEFETREIVFQKDEPTQIRVVLLGEGNYPELNAIDLNFPPHVEVLSRRVYGSSPGQFSSQTFEATIAVHGASDFTLPATSFLYFDPQKAKYERLSLHEIPFRFAPSVPRLAGDEREPIPWPAVEENWSTHTSLLRNKAYWAFHLVALLALVGILLLKALREWGEKRRQSPAFQRALRTDIALQALQMGNLEMFLRLADQIAYDVLLEKSKAISPRSRRDLVQWAENRVDEALRQAAQALFAAHDGFLYSPEKKQPTELDSLKTALRSLCAPKSASRRAA